MSNVIPLTKRTHDPFEDDETSPEFIEWRTWLRTTLGVEA